jgi:hypothetical protein
MNSMIMAIKLIGSTVSRNQVLQVEELSFAVSSKLPMFLKMRYDPHDNKISGQNKRLPNLAKFYV